MNRTAATRTLRALALAGAALALVTAATARALSVGAPAPEIGLPDTEGHVVRVSELRGKVVIVDFWASWCAPCREELPFLDRLASSRAERGLVVIGVSVDDEARTMRDFLRRAPVHFPIVHDPGKTIPRRYEPGQMPTSYLIDRRGVVRFVQGGFHARDKADLERRIDALLAE